MLPHSNQTANEIHGTSRYFGITSARRQHTVPRFFLRKFRDESEPPRIGDLERYLDFESGENVAAVRNNFYDIDLNGITVPTETWLNEVEGKAAPIIAALIDKPGSISTLPDVQDFDLARFLAALHRRTQHYRDSTDATVGKAIEQVNQTVKDMDAAQGIDDIGPVYESKTGSDTVAYMLARQTAG